MMLRTDKTPVENSLADRKLRIKLNVLIILVQKNAKT